MTALVFIGLLGYLSTNQNGKKLYMFSRLEIQSSEHTGSSSRPVYPASTGNGHCTFLAQDRPGLPQTYFLHCENRHFLSKLRVPAQSLGALGYWAPVNVHPCFSAMFTHDMLYFRLEKQSSEHTGSSCWPVYLTSMLCLHKDSKCNLQSIQNKQDYDRYI